MQSTQCHCFQVYVSWVSWQIGEWQLWFPDSIFSVAMSLLSTFWTCRLTTPQHDHTHGTRTHGMLPLGCQWKVGKTVRPWRRAQGSSHSGRFWQVLRLLEKIHSVEVQFKSSNAGAMLPHGIFGILGNLLRIFGWYVPWNPFFFLEHGLWKV